MPYYTMKEIADKHNMSAKKISNILNSKSCIYKDPNNMKNWKVYNTFTQGIKAPYKRCGNSILWSEEMLERIDKILNKQEKAATTRVIDNSKPVNEENWYLRKYFDKTYGYVFQMTRQTKGPGSYAQLNDRSIRYNFVVDCNFMGIKSNSKKKTKLLTGSDPNFTKWDTYMIVNKLPLA